MIQHDPRCDRQHTPRQQCNRRMTPAAARLARLATEAADEPAERQPLEVESPEPRSEAAGDAVTFARVLAEDVPELEPDPVREAVATIEPLEPTVFVSREVSETADAVEQASRQPSAPPARASDQPDPARAAAVIGLAAAIVLLLMLRLAHRSGRD